MESNIITRYGILPAKLENTYYIEYSSYNAKDKYISLKNLIEKVHGSLIEIGSENDSTYKVNATCKQDLDEYEFKILNTCIKKKYMDYYNLDIFIQDLVNKDILPCSTYVVSVSW